jgi:thiol-disulfide isomerase/thioredoxin
VSIIAPMASEWQAEVWFNTQAPLVLPQLRGRVVLLHAFQMLCPGCVTHAVPQAERVHREYAELGVSVIGLHTVFEHHAAMTPLALEVFLHEYRVTHPVGVDVAVAGTPIPATMQPSLITHPLPNRHLRQAMLEFPPGFADDEGD